LARFGPDFRVIIGAMNRLIVSAAWWGPEGLARLIVGGTVAALAAASIMLVPATATAAPPDIGRHFVYRALGVGPEGEGFAPQGLRLATLGDSPGDALALTNDPGDEDPAVSPDGRWVAFTRYIHVDGTEGSTGALFLMRSDGSDLRRLTSPAPVAVDREPSFTPSGKRILFVRLEDETVRGTNEGDIYSIGLDGGGLHQITSGRYQDRSPVASPNGRQIVFARPPGPPFQSRIPDIYSVRTDGSHLVDLTPRIPARHRRTERITAAKEPTFSPNGRVIAFAVANDSGSEGIDTMRPDGSNINSLVGRGPRALNRRFGLSEPEFSPTGRTLLVTARDRYHREIALIDLADRSRLLTPHSVQGESPAW